MRNMKLLGKENASKAFDNPKERVVQPSEEEECWIGFSEKRRNRKESLTIQKEFFHIMDSTG